MKAIVNVPKNNGRALFNGKTYDVKSLNYNSKGLISLQINSEVFAFEKKEVIIIDIVTEAKRAFKFKNSNDTKKAERYHHIWSYIKANNIIIPPFNMLDCENIEWEDLAPDPLIGVKFYEKGFEDIILTLKEHASSDKITLTWDKKDKEDPGESSMLRVVVEGFFDSGKWIKI